MFWFHGSNLAFSTNIFIVSLFSCCQRIVWWFYFNVILSACKYIFWEVQKHLWFEMFCQILGILVVVFLSHFLKIFVPFQYPPLYRTIDALASSVLKMVISLFQLLPIMCKEVNYCGGVIYNYATTIFYFLP